MSEPFQTDRDTVRSAAVSVTNVTLDSRGTATFTTAVNHNYVVGWQVTIEGAGPTYDGTWYIESVTANTFTVSILQPAIEIGTQPGLTLTNAVAYSPAPAYVRFDSRDATLSAIGTYVTLKALPWDYNTVRVSWSADSAVEDIAQQDVSAGLAPRVCIVRSTFGYPTTPLDGIQILNEKFVDAIPSITRSARIGTGETQPANLSNAFNRPNSGLLAFYDRNLSSGRWHYYSIFFLLKGDSNSAYWRLAKSVDALTPINYENGRKLYELIPPYYRYRDQEFTPGRGRKGDLERLINTIGFELDYTRTLAEGIEHLYDIDYVNDELLRYLGEGNFGIPNEGGLGDIRYRSLLAAISRLYDERGSSRGLEEMTFAATKYRCKVLEGINLMNLTDDAEFAESTGAWANPQAVSAYQSFISSLSPWIQGSTTGGSSVNFSTAVTLSVERKTKTSSTSESSASLVPRRNMLRVSASSVGTRILIACGLGEGVVQDRMRAANAAPFQPRTHGIRCTPGYLYSFSIFSRLVFQQTAGSIGIGIMWFNEPQGGVFATSDYISKTELGPQAELSPGTSDSTSMKRFTVTSKAPLSSLGQPFVYAVPYIVFSNGSARLISACMFYEQLNTVQQQTAAPLPQPTLTLGVTTEKLASEYKLGD